MWSKASSILIILGGCCLWKIFCLTTPVPFYPRFGNWKPIFPGAPCLLFKLCFPQSRLPPLFVEGRWTRRWWACRRRRERGREWLTLWEWWKHTTWATIARSSGCTTPPQTWAREFCGEIKPDRAAWIKDISAVNRLNKIFLTTFLCHIRASLSNIMLPWVSRSIPFSSHYWCAILARRYMMDFLVMRMRKHAFKAMMKAYSPTIPLAYIQVPTDSAVVFLHELRYCGFWTGGLNSSGMESTSQRICWFWHEWRISKVDLRSNM